jgi:hypothetical protein
MSSIGGRHSVRKRKQRNLHYFQLHPPSVLLGMLLRNNTTILEVMTTYIGMDPTAVGKGPKSVRV